MEKIISGYSHSFDTGVAKHCGSDAAAIFNHIIFWIKHNRNKGYNFYKNKTWMYESCEEMSKILDYLTPRQIKYAIEKLIECGLIVKEKIKKSQHDQTNWYSLADESILGNHKNCQSIGQNCQIEKTNLSNDDWTNLSNPLYIRDIEKDKKLRDIESANANVAIAPSPPPNFSKSSKKKEDKEKSDEKINFGEVVRLTQKQYDDLCLKQGKENVDRMIEVMNNHIIQFGYQNKYKCHAAALRNWFLREEKSGNRSNYYQKPKVDRRTRDINGNPVENQYQDLF